MKNIRLDIAYDGTNYAGWQVQPEAATVQGTIEAAIHGLTGKSARLHGSGRTDAGVHALGQVAHFKTDASIPPARWRPALNGVLPRDIVIRESRQVDDDFHARYSAKQKTYRYLIDNGAASSNPMLRSAVWRFPSERLKSGVVMRRLDEESMSRAGVVLSGTHDFSSFESKSAPDESSVRTVSRLVVRRTSQWDPWQSATETTSPEIIAIEITADGFLYNMVRAIVGTLVEIGLHARPADDMLRVLEACDRSQAGVTAPPEGLYLVSVDYTKEAAS